MRTIKFRAWDKIQKKMLFSDANNEIAPIHFDNGKFYVIEFYDGREVKAYDGVLMQFTGLLDKSGKEIYEGDILGDESDDSVKDVVKFGYIKQNNDSWGVAYCSTGFYIEYPDKTTNPIHDLEGTYGCRTSEHVVIGNIHEHPNLLNKE